MNNFKLSISRFYYLAGALLAIFCTSFLSQVILISPIYISYCLVYILLIFIVSRCSIIKYKTHLSSYFSIFVYTIYISIQSLFEGQNLKYPLLMAMSASYYPIGCVIFDQLTRKQIITICKYILLVTCIILIIDCIYRFLHPTELRWVDSFTFFYKYKMNTIMFTDTNDVGFLILLTMGFILYLKSSNSLNISFYVQLLFFVLLILSFSRAAIVAYLISYFILNIYNRLNLVGRFIANVVIVIAVVYLFILFLSDGSFLTKIEILQECYVYLLNVDFCDLLFGIGYAQSETVLGIYGHNYIVLYLIEFGLIGLFLFSVTVLSIYMQTNSNAKYLIYPYLIAGLSFAPYILPYFFLYSAVIKRLSTEDCSRH